MSSDDYKARLREKVFRPGGNHERLQARMPYENLGALGDALDGLLCKYGPTRVRTYLEELQRAAAGTERYYDWEEVREDTPEETEECDHGDAD